MPIVANPAAPFAPQINSKFAASEQFNKIFPTLAGLYEAAGRNYTSASAQTAQNQTQASAVSAGLEARNIAQQREIEAEMQARQYQAQAQMEMQRREEEARMQRLMLPITRQEEQEQQARMSGIVQIEKMMEEGTMTKEQGGLALLQLTTKTATFNDRMKFQQAKALEQQTEMQAKMFADNQKDLAAAKMHAAKYGSEAFFGLRQHNGDIDLFDFDPQRGTFSQIGKRTAAVEKPENPQMALGADWAPFTTKFGGFDKGAAIKRTEELAKIEFDDPKSKEARDWMRMNVQAIEDAWNGAKSSSGQSRAQNRGAPVTAPQQQQVDPEIAKLQEKGLPPQQLQFATQVVQLMRTLIEKGKSGELSPAEKAQLAQTIEQYKSLQR